AETELLGFGMWPPGKSSGASRPDRVTLRPSHFLLTERPLHRPLGRASGTLIQERNGRSLPITKWERIAWHFLPMVNPWPRQEKIGLCMSGTWPREKNCSAAASNPVEQL